MKAYRLILFKEYNLYVYLPDALNRLTSHGIIVSRVPHRILLSESESQQILDCCERLDENQLTGAIEEPFYLLFPTSTMKYKESWMKRRGETIQKPVPVSIGHFGHVDE